MIFVSATRLRLKSFIYLPQFMLANEASVKQLVKTPGFKSGLELIDKRLTFWTVTAWENVEVMKVFRNSEPHRKAMQKLPKWCNEASYAHWMQEDEAFPDWQTIHAKIIEEGKITKVRNPSPHHLLKDYPAPQRTKFPRPLKPQI